MRLVVEAIVRLAVGRDEEGQGLAEYALILGLIAVVAIVALAFLGDAINDLMVLIGDTVDSNT